MSEEEKKAIKACDTIFMCLEDMMSEESANDYRASYRLIKNLITKQQKEIEDLKNNELDYTTIYINGVYEGKKYYKDKIREKIEEIESFDKAMHQKNGQFTILVLQGLLKENIKEENS